jgi:hypothetical protein
MDRCLRAYDTLFVYSLDLCVFPGKQRWTQKSADSRTGSWRYFPVTPSLLPHTSFSPRRMTASYTTSGIPTRFAGPSTPDDYLTPVTSPLPTAVPNSTPSSTPPPSATVPSPPSPVVLAAHDPHGRGTDNGALVALTREASMEEYLSVTAGQRRVSIESGLRVGLGMPFDERGVGEQVGREGRRESMGRKRDYGMVEVGLGVVEGEGGGVAKARMIRDLMKALGEEKSRTAALELNLFGAHQEVSRAV